MCRCLNAAHSFLWRQLMVHLSRQPAVSKKRTRKQFGTVIIWGCFRLSPVFWGLLTGWILYSKGIDNYPSLFGIMTIMAFVVWGLFEYARSRAKTAVSEIHDHRFALATVESRSVSSA